MNFKIEINYLNIENYHNIEPHLEKMAKKGWLLTKILAGVFFIYKKIEPQALNFSVSPYEVETAYTRKTKKDLEEFQTVSEMVGWNYVTKSYDFHVYFKTEETEAIPIRTDEEEEFKLVEKIGKKNLRAHYIVLPLMLFVSWFMLRRLLNYVQALREGLTQITALILPVAIVLSLLHIFDLRKLLKTNRKRIEEGKSLMFTSSKQGLYKFLYVSVFILMVVFVLYNLYAILVLRNSSVFFGFLPIIIGTFFGYLSRMVIKPLGQGRGFKMSAIVGMGALAGVVVFMILQLNFENSTETDSQEILNPNVSQVLRADHFVDEELEEWGGTHKKYKLLNACLS